MVRKTKKRTSHKRGGAQVASSSWRDRLKKINNVAKQTKILSTIADMTGNPVLGAEINQAGYGRRGGSWIGNIAGKITSIPVGFGVGALMGAQGAIKGLGKRGGRYQPRPAYRVMRVM